MHQLMYHFFSVVSDQVLLETRLNTRNLWKRIRPVMNGGVMNAIECIMLLLLTSTV